MSCSSDMAGFPRGVATLFILVAMVFTSACYTPQAVRDVARGDDYVSWWCRGADGHPDLPGNNNACQQFSLEMDVAVYRAQTYPTLGDALAAGATSFSSQPAGIGHAVSRPGAPSGFDPAEPNVLLYNGTTPDSRIAGVAWRLGGAQPDGFDGTRDVWALDNPSGYWWLSAWVIRGYQNHANVFAATQPCLAAGVIPTSTSDSCFVEAHPEPLEIVVANDDGYASEGIYALVDGLNGLPGVTVHVVAPGANQSGSSDQVTGEGFVVSATAETIGTAPHNIYPATAVWSTDPDRPSGSGSPADAVKYALGELLLSPEIVLSGINDGQNLAKIGSDFSGTVGAARTARRLGFSAIATSSAGLTVEPDFPASVAATLALLEQWRLGNTTDNMDVVLNINTPTCPDPDYPVRGTLWTDVGGAINDRDYGYFDPSDCVTPGGTILDDFDAYHKGYISIGDMGRILPPTY